MEKNILSKHDLLEENCQLKDEIMCKVCKDLNSNRMLLPCGHLVVCNQCLPFIQKCPILKCKKRITGHLVVYPEWKERRYHVQ
jgi:hypothetical protein